MQIAEWIAYSIVKEHVLERRVEVLQYFIQTADVSMLKESKPLFANAEHISALPPIEQLFYCDVCDSWIKLSPRPSFEGYLGRDQVIR
jgi:hypothetical protein